MLSAVMLVSAAGCSKGTGQEANGGGSKDSAQGSADQKQDDYVYVPEYSTLGEGCSFVSDAVFGDDGKLYYIGINSEEESGLYTVDVLNGGQNEVPFRLERGNYLGGLFEGPDGSLILTVYQYKGELNKEEEVPPDKMMLQTISTDGNVKSSVDITGMLTHDPDFYAADITMDEKGNYYISGGQMLYVLNPDGELLYEVPVGYYIDSIFTLRTGEIVVCYMGGEEWKMEQVDSSRQELKKLESKTRLNYGTYQEGESSDLLYTLESVLYQYNLKDEEPVRLLSWIDCSVESTYIKKVKQLSDEKIAVISQDWSGSAPELTVLTRKNRSEVKEKTVITLGTFYVPYYTDSDIIAFNKQSQDYRIEVKKYGDEKMNYEDRIALMNMDITNGQGPDMFDLDRVPYSLDMMISKGLVEDLTSYLEKDPDLKREDFVDSAMKVYERDSRLYGIMTRFAIRTMMGRVSDLGNRESWTLDEMMEFADAQPKDVELIPNAAKDSMLELLCSMNIGSFMDEETGACDFSGEQFQKILEFANRFPDKAESSTDDYTRIRNGQAVLLEATVSAVSLYQMYEYVYGEPVNFIGYPTSGNGKGTAIWSEGTVVGMNPSSSKKEGVWEFIRFLLSDERQEKEAMGSGGFPIKKEALEKQFAEDMTPEYYEDADGNRKEQPKSYWGTESFSVEVYAATQEQVDQLKKIIDNAGDNSSADGEVLSIIHEEARAYFTGQKTSGQVAELIQNRVQNYVNESR